MLKNKDKLYKPRTRFITSESVGEGHPDKICDLISDTILTEALKQDRNSRMAVECTIKDNFIFIYGEKNTKAKLNYQELVKKALTSIGYKQKQIKKFKIHTKVGEQSSEINSMVNSRNEEQTSEGNYYDKELCAGDQGIVYGYATNSIKYGSNFNYMPVPIYIAHDILKMLSDTRKMLSNEQKDVETWILPDSKAQVTVEYEGDTPIHIDNIIVSTQHFDSVSIEHVRLSIGMIVKDYMEHNEKYDSLFDDDTEIHINPYGSFTIGGSYGDSGTTGRKIVVDTYGGVGRVGGGCFSSKDATKVDRSGAYYARYVAKNIVHNGLADICEIQVAYVIGGSMPVSIDIECFGTNRVSYDEIHDFIMDNDFNFMVHNTIEELDLLNFDYTRATNYGHFKLGMPWEVTHDLRVKSDSIE